MLPCLSSSSCCSVFKERKRRQIAGVAMGTNVIQKEFTVTAAANENWAPLMPSLKLWIICLCIFTSLYQKPSSINNQNSGEARWWQAITWHVHCGYGGRGDQSGGCLLLDGQRGHGIPWPCLTGCRWRTWSCGEQAWWYDCRCWLGLPHPRHSLRRIGGSACRVQRFSSSVQSSFYLSCIT